jgi:hypothetical protein
MLNWETVIWDMLTRASTRVHPDFAGDRRVAGRLQRFVRLLLRAIWISHHQ